MLHDVVLLCRIVQGWLGKMLWCWPDNHDTYMWNAWATQFGFLRQHPGPISMSSYYNMMATRRYCNGFTLSCCLPKTISHLRVPFVLSLWGKNARCHRWSHEVNTKMTWLDKIPHDGLTKGKMDTQIQHDHELLRGLWAILWVWKRSRSSWRTGKTEQMVIRWYKMA